MAASEQPERIRIGTWQGPIAEGDPNKNTETVLRVMEQARPLNLHFLCFPEAYLTGYSEQAVRERALSLSSEEVRRIRRASESLDTVILVGLAERTAEGIYNSQVVVHRGAILGTAHKTMLTHGYDDRLFVTDLDLPVFEAHGIRFGVAICHSTSFVEPALYLRWLGVRLLFTPHYNDVPPEQAGADGIRRTMWEHRRMVLHNQAALATLLKMVVVRSNIVKVDPDHLGVGDSAVWGMDGQILAAGVPFTEELVVAEVDGVSLRREHWIDRREIPLQLLEMITDAARTYDRGTP